MEDLRNRRVTVMGLGRFGGDCCFQMAGATGAEVLVTDKEKADALKGSVAQLDGLAIRFRLGEHRHEGFSERESCGRFAGGAADNVYLQTARAAGWF